jgi:hypothetical protein
MHVLRSLQLIGGLHRNHLFSNFWYVDNWFIEVSKVHD